MLGLKNTILTDSIFKRIPKHVGIIPDGNRRWAMNHGLSKEQGYFHSLTPSKCLCNDILQIGVEEVTAYCFTQENVKRPKYQVLAFKKALVQFISWVKHKKNVSVLVVGDTNSSVFPPELLPFTIPEKDREFKIKFNFLVNYNWRWDVKNISLLGHIHSREVSRIDLILRWGNRSRLSGFVPLQSAYSDIFILDNMFPDYKTDDLVTALNWYGIQDITMGG